MFYKILRRFILVCMLSLGSIPAGLAQSSSDYDSIDPTGATVTFWHQHSRAREESLLAIVQAFNETNEYGITVEAIYQGNYSDIFNTMLTVMNTDDVPNLVVAYQNQAATYHLLGGLVDINALIENSKWGLTDAEVTDFFPSFYNSDVFEGVRVGFPPNRSTEVMYVNVSWLNELRESGAISFDGIPTTPEQFREASCAALSNPYSGATGDPASSLGYEINIDASRFASWVFGFGGNVFDYENNRYSYNSTESVAAMTYLQALFADGCGRMITEQFGDQNNFGAGTTLFTTDSTTGIPVYTELVANGTQHEWTIAPLPYITAEPVINVYGASVSIPKSTPEQELAAWLFVKYYTSASTQAEWARSSRYFPVRASVAENLAEYFEQQPIYKIGFDMLEYGITEPPTPGYDFVRNEVTDALAAILEGADVQTTLDELNAVANEILEDQF